MHTALALPWQTRDFEQVVQDMKEGKLQSFWNDRAIILTEICVSPRRRFLNIFLAAGDLRGLYRLQPKIVQFARDNDLTEAQAIFRPEWTGVLKKRGWAKWAELWHLPIETWNRT